MPKLPTVGGLLLVALATTRVDAAVLGPDPAACAPGGDRAAVLVHVTGFKAPTGDLRVQVYGSRPEDFLAKGRKLARVDVAVRRPGPMDVCVPLPAPGNYAVAVRHDIDGSGKSGWNDGGGFSRNPKLNLFKLKPDYEDVVVTIGRTARPLSVVLNYRQGLSIGPVGRAG